MLFELNGWDEVEVADTADAAVFKKKRDDYVRKQFAKWDINNDEMISLDEFYLFFYTEVCFKFPLLRTGVNPGADLANVFEKYAERPLKAVPPFEMGILQFSKLCRDSKLLNGTTVTSSVVDLVYYRARAELEGLETYGSMRATGKMLYPQFLFALQKIANKRRTGFQEVVARILSNVSAKPYAKMADLVIFTSDGTEAEKEEFLERPRGLPSNHSFNTDMTGRMMQEADLADQYGLPTSKKKPEQTGFDRFTRLGQQPLDDIPPTPSLNAPATVDGMENVPPASAFIEPAKDDAQENESLPEYEKVADTAKLKQWGLKVDDVHLPKTGSKAVENPSSILVVRALTQDNLLMGLKKVFETYNLWDHGVNKGAMDKIRFMKVWRDAHLVTEGNGFGLSTTVFETIWQKVLPQARSTVNFPLFVDTLRQVAMLLRISLNEVMERIVIVQKPQ